MQKTMSRWGLFFLSQQEETAHLAADQTKYLFLPKISLQVPKDKNRWDVQPQVIAIQYLCVITLS